MGRLLYGYWDCAYCGRTAIRGDKRECPGCGKPRDEHTKFYMHKKEYVSKSEAENVNRNPDWICHYCNQLNSDNDTVCVSCGASRDGENKNYFDARAKEKQKEAERNVRKTQTTNFESSNDFYVTPQVAEKPKKKKKDNGNPYRESVEELKRRQDAWEEANPTINERLEKCGNQIGKFFKKYGVTILIVLLSAALIAGLVYLFIPKEHNLTVQEMSWKRSITIEKYDWVDESGWSLPHGARLERTAQEIASYIEVLDHYETKTRQVVVGYEEKVTGYKDLGNGYFEEIVTQVPVYGTEEYQEPVYRSQPVYQTKYYYEIQKWVHGRSVTTNGTGLNPYWGEVVLGKDERQGTSSETYTIVGVNEEGEELKVTMDYDDYMRLEIGAVVKVKVTLGHAEIVLE